MLFCFLYSHHCPWVHRCQQAIGFFITNTCNPNEAVYGRKESKHRMEHLDIRIPLWYFSGPFCQLRWKALATALVLMLRCLSSAFKFACLSAHLFLFQNYSSKVCLVSQINKNRGMRFSWNWDFCNAYSMLVKIKLHWVGSSQTKHTLTIASSRKCRLPGLIY